LIKSQSSYDLLIEKLDQFIRKYYINQLLKGSLYFVGLTLALFILFNVLEYYFYFGQSVRKLFFYGFIATSVLGFVTWVFIPLVKYFKLGSVISYEQAASIIGTHFTDVKDKLLNILQLKKQSESSSNYSLVEASINQKTEDIKFVPFKSAINLYQNKKYLKYALPPFLLLIVLVFAAPSIITDSTNRIINNNKDFEREAPFRFEILNKELEVVQYEDYTLDVYVDGKTLPNEAFIQIDNFNYKLDKKDNNHFSYEFKNVKKVTPFKIVSGSVEGNFHILNVIEKPVLSDFELSLDYPSYTGRKDEKLSNIGDILIPEGTKVKWLFKAKNTDDLKIKFDSGQSIEMNHNDDVFQYEKTLKSDSQYKIFLENQRIKTPDSISYQINVIKDQYPSISVERYNDSLAAQVVYFLGNISDDYGISTLTFNYEIIGQEGNLVNSSTKKLDTNSSPNQAFNYTLDADELKLENGQELRFYFEVKDNDAVNGHKSSKSSIMNFRKASLKEIQEEQDKKEEELKKQLEKSLTDLDKMQENFKKMREKLLQKKELDFQDKKELEKMLERQKELNQNLENAKQNFEKNKETQKQLNQQEEEILEKQEKLEKLFDKIMDPEKQELMDKIQELLQELDKEDAIQMMEKFEMDNETMEKEMDRLLELYKQLEMEKEVKEQIDKLEELAEKQEELAEKTEKKEGENDELKKEQEKLNDEFKDIEKKLDELQEKNKELSPPKNLGEKEENQEQMDDIQEDMEQSQEQMEQENNSGASKSQKSAAKKMKSMAGNLQSSMESGDEEKSEEDLKALRQLLENLVTISFDQESLIGDFDQTDVTTPKYVDHVKTQFKLKDDFKIVEDSLTELSKRVSQIETFVTEKVADVKYDFDKSLDLLEERNKPEAKRMQRSAMTNLNDLALMLSEAMENMQKQMGASMPGSQMCNKPGGASPGKSGKVPSDKISEGQQQLNEDMKSLSEKLKNGKGSAKDFGEAAARQAALRKALQDLKQQKQEQGKGGTELDDIINDMNKVETDLVNKRFDNDVLKRQQDIETRLLEAEKADRQREFDNKRKSEEGKDVKRAMPAALQEYLRKRETELELYRTTSPALKPYYRNLVDEYNKALKKSN